MNIDDKFPDDTSTAPSDDQPAPSVDWLLREVQGRAHELYAYALRLLDEPLTAAERSELMIRRTQLLEAMARVAERTGDWSECQRAVTRLTSRLLAGFEEPVTYMVLAEVQLHEGLFETYQHTC